MLTNRYHHNRWSLEQNRVIPDPERPNRRSYLIRTLLFLLVGGMIYFVVDRHLLLHSSEFETLLDAADGAIMVNDHREHEAHGVLLPVDAPKDLLRTEKSNYAYVTLLCDNSGLANARVLAYGLKRAKAQFPLIIMTLPFATEGLEELVSLGATIEKISMVPTPFKRSNGKRPSFQRLCKYSKIHAWSLTKYSKLVFLDPSLLVVQNFDEVFQYPEFSAVKVVGDEFNTGMFVLEPSARTHQEMLNVYKLAPPNFFGEQGFLNWFFQNRTTNVISTRYNTNYAVWPMLRRNAKVFHFVPHTSPWNFHIRAHPEWELNFEPIIFYYWHQMHLQALQTVHREEFSPYVNWPNLRRSIDICAPQSTSYTPRKFIIQNKFSVLIGTWDRVALLRKLILHYQKSRLVHKIYVTWHNPGIRPPEELLKTVRKKPPVEILPQKYDSLNNRFNPIPNLETKALLVCDDDVRVNITDIEYAFDVWKGRQNSLVGVFPRFHSYNSHNNTYNYEIRSPDRPRIYSIMLTKFMFINAEFLYIYTCLLPLKIHKYIDDNMNCEDIAMNLMVSGMTGSKPSAVLLHVDDFGTTSGISIKGGHLTSRSQCMTDLVRLFGKDTLLYNREVFLPFRKKKAT